MQTDNEVLLQYFLSFNGTFAGIFQKSFSMLLDICTWGMHEAGFLLVSQIS
jgi:hypothetical protein